ncbi:beta-xylosidase 1 [Actinidia rufa]|uniref:Beta-xylosidase 1 n=1 Tax=Actinidia rufa TaxID=165716 RepID=A0A7J0GL32_9ERIC|nr:beta-xylosidase 1 [Actinidia rufa]
MPLKPRTHSPLLLSLIIILCVCAHTVRSRPAFACVDGPTRTLPFCRAGLPIHVRVRDLIGRLTLQEKIRLLVNNAAAVPRLGIGGYEWWSEALHGVSDVGPGVKFGGAFPGATSFPQVITTAASFNASLWKEIGRVVSDEARAMYNGGMAGITYWSPNVNIFRDPRWGRGQETPAKTRSWQVGMLFNTSGDSKVMLETASSYIVSDCDSVGVLYDLQHYTATPEDAAAATIKAGLDLDCGPFLAIHTEGAVRQGKLSEADVNGALANTITVQMRLGMFDVARHRTVAVIGPNSDVTVTMIGNYAGKACGYTTPLQGIGRYARTIHQLGCSGVACLGNQQFGAAEAAARQADATVLVMGLDQSMEAEFRDRTGVLLPGHQQELVSRVAMVSRGPLVLVLMSGGPIDVSFAKNDPRVVAILWVGYPGQAGGTAIADVLFGRTNPGGKLPMTWYPQEYLARAPMTNMAMRADPARGYPGRTYRFYKGPVVFPFGYGLSYTTFAHELAHAPTAISVPLTSLHELKNTTTLSTAIRVKHTNCDTLSLGLHIDVKNTGHMDGTHTLLVFSTPPIGKWAPERHLVGFETVHVVAGGQQRVKVDLDVCKHLSVVDQFGIRRIQMGEHSLHIGDIKHSISLQMALDNIKS